MPAPRGLVGLIVSLAVSIVIASDVILILSTIVPSAAFSLSVIVPTPA